MTEDTARFGYPIVLDLHGVDVLVVGAGPVAARKVAGLAAAGAVVRVIAPDVSAAMDAEVVAGNVATLSRRRYAVADVAGARLVVAATGDEAVDAAVAADATAAGVWVNAADQRGDCSFILPAIARRGPLSIAVSTDGTSPALARRLRDRAGELLTDDVVALAVRLEAERAAIRSAGGSTETVDWASHIDPVVAPPRAENAAEGH
ncbi:precorrin-2 dehydrogenase/sirohydrochlorin ferrochelatase family protein [Desertimonas flava]|jgi:siroheme synthase-like protein|uniref:precorrin-2 dehydrogenase/sirohydrochlorin ferrochelatase family protein n=1 Tax=Desertimonas flava TaxID=2064846 RepID=UPI000E34249C|nr:NAD(P)-dependent oxidoreductase [Desertimonas flava]